jgi:hypothetical protein
MASRKRKKKRKRKRTKRAGMDPKTQAARTKPIPLTRKQRLAKLRKNVEQFNAKYKRELSFDDVRADLSTKLDKADPNAEALDAQFSDFQLRTSPVAFEKSTSPVDFLKRTSPIQFTQKKSVGGKKRKRRRKSTKKKRRRRKKKMR